ncbi:hypothetical protein GCM10007978_12520 [Shewanella hanedai]|uniref:Uncharacterized protein n=1 Tax=Shewanella hanedai TaxID=25 RepID=A0A553JQK0_SHEHA|nr:hypothetical protein [Shewanella hanedai]TRY14754.1 hypothetical protein FN961_08660 [Shewanella hanedai]GGI76432.1 hypothetical protein GCM10007978_12520 [Shewanella hanedai]
MVGKKIWANAKDKHTNKYVIGTEHPLKLYYVWEASKLQKTNPALFDNLQFMSTHRIEDDRRKMHLHTNGFFRYNPNQAPKGSADGDSDSISHMLAIAAITKLSSINFVCGRQSFVVKPTSVDTEQRIQLVSEGKYKYYIPDIVFTFNDDSHWAKRWGNKLAVEVKHTHACEQIKIKDFEGHGIPIVEVSIGSVSIEQKFETKSPNMQQMQEYFEYLCKIFGNQVYGKLLSNPVSLTFHQEAMATKINELNLAEHSHKTLKRKHEALETTVMKQGVDFKHSQGEIDTLRREIDTNISSTNMQKSNMQAEVEKLKLKLFQTESDLQAERSKGWFDKLLGR